ncbi:unnamed protein product [Nippostrongylus brasiliensis]|uniref:Uncharacterized protein n=1 Tax=Nippostrongylus brasiliensis TaxID=27835 RepID=A0A0N4Y9W8_NIPBR|nr:unnamed protein product [Nippostrongylus brasiliensis]
MTGSASPLSATMAPKMPLGIRESTLFIHRLGSLIHEEQKTTSEYVIQAYYALDDDDYSTYNRNNYYDDDDDYDIGYGGPDSI